MSLFENNDRIQEWLLVINDRLSTLGLVWWYSLCVALLLSIPLYIGTKIYFYNLAFNNYAGPEIIYQPAKIEELKILDKQVFDLGNDNFSGFVRIQNINLNHGVPEQSYVAEFKTAGSTSVTKVVGKTFILPASEKIIIFARFTAKDNKPSSIDFALDNSKFQYKPQLPQPSLGVERIQMEMQKTEFSVSASLKNLSPFTIKQINLPVLLYDGNSRIVGVNFAIVNQVKSYETRGVQYLWPKKVEGAVRAEINPEVNIFDKALLTTEPTEPQLQSLQTGGSN